jgi:hypothetical protein
MIAKSGPIKERVHLRVVQRLDQNHLDNCDAYWRVWPASATIYTGTRQNLSRGEALRPCSDNGAGNPKQSPCLITLLTTGYAAFSCKGNQI